jgi:hypothetical protein
MRVRLALGPLLVAGIVAGSLVLGSADAARRATAARPQATVKVQIPLPAQGHAEVMLVTVKATARRGKKLGRVRVTTANDAQLPANIRAVAVTARPRKRTARETVEIYVLVNRPTSFGKRTGHAIAAQASTLDFTVHIESASSEETGTIGDFSGDCGGLEKLDRVFESGATVVNTHSPKLGIPQTWTLVSLRTSGEQPSPPERVLDFAVANASGRCAPIPGFPEGGDDGNT